MTLKVRPRPVSLEAAMHRLVFLLQPVTLLRQITAGQGPKASPMLLKRKDRQITAGQGPQASPMLLKRMAPHCIVWRRCSSYSEEPYAQESPRRIT